MCEPINGHQLALMQVLGWRVRIFGPFHRLTHRPNQASVLCKIDMDPKLLSHRTRTVASLNLVAE